MVVPAGDITASRAGLAAAPCAAWAKPSDFGFVLYDIDCILVADFIQFLGRNQSERVGRR